MYVLRFYLHYEISEFSVLRLLALLFPSASMFLSVFASVWKEVVGNICFFPQMESLTLLLL